MTPDEIHELPATEQGPVDALIVTALQDELEAVLALGEGGRSGWRDLRDLGGFPYHCRTFPSARGGVLTVAAAWIGEMGERTAAIRGQQLLTELDPACLAMCGICAGYREKVALGDVIIADRLYSYDEGKRVVEPGKEAELFHDLRTFDLQATWKMDAALLPRELDLSALSRERPPSKEAQRRWLLHTLHAHEAEGGAPPMTHPDRARACPTWTDRLKDALHQGFVAMHAGRLALTEQGREAVLTERIYHPDGLPADPPLRVHVGAIATGKAVQEDPALFDHLRRLVRGTLGLEMEGAAIGDLASRFEKRSIVMKAVSDHADLDKDDSFRRFACHASATVLLAFLQKHLEPEQRPHRESAKRHGLRGGEGRLEGGERFFEDRREGFLARVERVALLRDPGARVTRHAAPPPFAGVLDIAVRDGALIDERVIGALEQPITEELFRQYQAEVEFLFRHERPFLRSTLIHTGPQAPPRLLEDAARRGVFLKTFTEYQGLIDFTRYLEWQTSRLEADAVYPPWLYVEQPARVSLADRREEQRTESALRSLWDLLDAPHPRFSLVLGDFGAGKTFLLHELARRMAKDKHPAVPVLVEMSRLEKQRSLKALLAQHFAMADMGRIDLDAFLYMLAEGRVALLFDGFDELALRLTYDRAEEHFETVLQAAQGNAKVVMTSRTQHFLTDHQIRRALALRAEQVPGYRLFTLERFGEPQIRRFLGNLIPAPEEAEERYRLLDEVKDLLGLSANPRMLGFIAKIEPERLREAKAQSGEITAAKLYEVLIAQWLDFEHARANPPGAPRGIARDKLEELVSKLAGVFWERNTKALELGELHGVLVAESVEPAAVEHMIGSGSLLVRDAEGRFSFIHQSVLEWLVARDAAELVKRAGDAACLGQQEMSDLMADFFNTLAGRDVARRWLAGKMKMAIAEQEIAKKNALRIERRLRDTSKDAAEEEIVIDIARDLEGQDLRGQDFAGADLVGANLRGADLSDATLVEANLTGANLQDAKLTRADLSRARLGKADLRGADLWQARLLGADLRGATLRQAKLRGAKLIKAQVDDLDGCDLTGAALLVPETIEHMIVSASEATSVAFSPDGVLLASGHADGTVHLRDAATGKALRVLQGHRAPVWSVAFAPDGLTVASASDNTIALWNLTSSRPLHVLEGQQGKDIKCVAFSPDGHTLASAGGTICLWNVSTGKVLRVLKDHQGYARSVVFAPDGSTLASAADTKTVTLWNVSTGEVLRVLEGHRGYVRSVVFAPDGLTLAAAADDKTVTLWNVATGKAVRVLEGHKASVENVAFAPDGLTLAAAATKDKTITLWSLATGEVLRVLEGDRRHVWSVAFAPDGRTLASAGGAIRLWDVATGRARRVLEGHPGHEIKGVVYATDGRTLAAAFVDNTVTLWSLATGKVLRVLQGHQGHVKSVALAPDGQTLVSAAIDTTVTLWTVAGGEAFRVSKGHKDGISSVAFASGAHPSASHFATTITLWNLATGDARCLLQGHRAHVWSVAFAPDGRTIATASDATVTLWDVATGHALRVFQGHGVGAWSMTFAPDGLTLATAGGDKTVTLWDVATGDALRVFQGHKHGILSVAFAPDGLTLAAASGDTTVTLWDVATGDALRVLKGHKDNVLSVAFAPDGLTLATASADATVTLWDVATGDALRVLGGHQAYVSSAAFAPDGLTLAAASADGTLRLWNAATGALLATYLKLPEGWVTFTPDGRYNLGGDIAGAFWHVIGLCRFEPGELDPYLDKPLRITDT